MLTTRNSLLKANEKFESEEKITKQAWKMYYAIWGPEKKGENDSHEERGGENKMRRVRPRLERNFTWPIQVAGGCGCAYVCRWKRKKKFEKTDRDEPM